MNEILKRIIDIENEAKEIIAQTAKIESDAPYLTKLEADKIAEELDEEMQIKLNNFRAQDSLRYENAVKQQEMYYEKQIKELEDLFNINGDKWKDRVYNSIVDTNTSA